jgi:hypothetical protein
VSKYGSDSTYVNHRDIGISQFEVTQPASHQDICVNILKWL